MAAAPRGAVGKCRVFTAERLGLGRAPAPLPRPRWAPCPATSRAPAHVRVAAAEETGCMKSSNDGTTTFSFGGDNAAEVLAASERALEMATGETASSSGEASGGDAEASVSNGVNGHTPNGGTAHGARLASPEETGQTEETVLSDAAEPEEEAAMPPLEAHVDDAAPQDDLHSSINDIPTPVLSYSNRYRTRDGQEGADGSDVSGKSQPKGRAPYHKLKQDVRDVLQRYRDACTDGDLQGALEALETARHEDMRDIFPFIKHKPFLRVASKAKAVPEALRFLQLLPRDSADSRTYNMVITVCANAADLPGALKVADMYEGTGQKLDRFHYTNLIKSAAAAANSDEAFRLYSNLQSEGIQPCANIITTLIDACSNEISKLSGQTKGRTQLVLMERAFQVFADGASSGVKADHPMWNALINAAGCGGQLDRAFQVVESMQASGLRPNDRSYCTLIACCKHANRSELAIKVYRKALRSGVTKSDMVYAAAVDACQGGDAAVGLKNAMDIYSDMQRNNILPTSHIFASLITCAGHAGDIRLALSLHEDMIFEGCEVDNVSRAAVISACLRNGDITKAKQIYEEMKADSRVKSTYGYNSMISVYAKSASLGNAVVVVEDMLKAGVSPDRHTYGALINVCQYCAEPELAFEVFKLMKQKGFGLDEATTFSLLRAAFNRIRNMWRKGGYPPVEHPKAAMHGMSPAAPSLLEALNCTPQAMSAFMDQPSASVEDWQKRAITVYREAITVGQPVALRTLDRVLGCLRLPLSAANQTNTNPNPAARNFAVPGANYLSQQGLAHQALSMGMSPMPKVVPEQEDQGDEGKDKEKKQTRQIEIQFDSRAVALLEEAIAIGMVPHYSLDADCDVTLDLRSLPPTVAEVYVLNMFRSLERAGSTRFRRSGGIALLVPPYNPSEIFSLSFIGDGHLEIRDPTGDSETVDDVSHDKEESWSVNVQDPAGTSTGLAVGAQLKRLKIYNHCYAAEGRVEVEAKEVTRWVRTRVRSAMNASRRETDDGPPAMGQTRASKGFLMAQQRRNIRTDSRP